MTTVLVFGKIQIQWCTNSREYRYSEHCGRAVNYYFWRTYDQKEVDLIEECGGWLHGYEFKWVITWILSPCSGDSCLNDPNPIAG
jgi:hypothetical protein